MLIGALVGAFGMLVLFLLASVVVKTLEEKNQRGSPQKPMCLLHIHEHRSQQVWHRGQFFHDHKHDHKHLDGEDVYTTTDGDGFMPSDEALEKACSEDEDPKTGTLPYMRLASAEEASVSGRLPEPSANGKSRGFGYQQKETLGIAPWMALQSSNIHERVRNADASIFPGEEAMKAADRADMTRRGAREVCLGEIEGDFQVEPHGV